MSIERIRRRDEGTGLDILQLTSFPLTHWPNGCTGDGISPDGRTILLHENHDATRAAGRDLYRVNSDGADFDLLLEGASGGIVTMDGQYAVVGKGSRLLRLRLDGGGAEEISGLGDGRGLHVSARSPDGTFAFGQSRRSDGSFDVIRCNLHTGTIDAVCRASYIMPVQAHGRDETRLLASIATIGDDGEPNREWGYWSFRQDGTDFRRIPFTRSTNHYVAIGRSDAVVTCTNHPAAALDVASPGDDAARALSHGAGFWHVTADASGEWAVADTNWPDTGLQLVHVPSGRFATVCATGASGGHPQWTHAHPCLAPTAEYVLFSSDRTGYAQIYLAPLGDELKRTLRSVE